MYLRFNRHRYHYTTMHCNYRCYRTHASLKYTKRTREKRLISPFVCRVFFSFCFCVIHRLHIPGARRIFHRARSRGHFQAGWAGVTEIFNKVKTVRGIVRGRWQNASFQWAVSSLFRSFYSAELHDSRRIVRNFARQDGNPIKYTRTRSRTSNEITIKRVIRWLKSFN